MVEEWYFCVCLNTSKIFFQLKELTIQKKKK